MRAIYLILAIFSSFLAYSQDSIVRSADTTCIERDLSDVIRKMLNKPPKDTLHSKGGILLFPIIGSNPATGFMVGVGGQYAFKRAGEATHYSMISGSAQFIKK